MSAHCRITIDFNWQGTETWLSQFDTPWVAWLKKYHAILQNKMYIRFLGGFPLKPTVLRERLDYRKPPERIVGCWASLLYAESRVANYSDTAPVMNGLQEMGLEPIHVASAIEYLYCGPRQHQLAAVELVSFTKGVL